MAIKLRGIRLKNNPEATTYDVVKETIERGLEHVDVAKKYKFWGPLRVTQTVGKIIRDCNQALGIGGSSKDGCLYREGSLKPEWDSKTEKVILDHAIPVTELVKQYHKGIPLELLIFSPVVRIDNETNEKLTAGGFSKSGHHPDSPLSFPLFRYSKVVGMSIVTHNGIEIDPVTWTDQDHWELVLATKELEAFHANIKENLLKIGMQVI